LYKECKRDREKKSETDEPGCGIQTEQDLDNNNW